MIRGGGAGGISLFFLLDTLFRFDHDLTQLSASSLFRPRCSTCKGSSAGFFLAPPLPLIPPQHEIHHPAAEDVRPRPAAVFEDDGIVAAGLLERVGEDRQVGETSLAVDASGQ